MRVPLLHNSFWHVDSALCSFSNDHWWFSFSCFFSSICLSDYTLVNLVWTLNPRVSFSSSLLSTEVFEELTVAVQEKDSLASELHVRHIAIEQLFKNCTKLPWLHISRAGVKASSTAGHVEWGVSWNLSLLVGGNTTNSWTHWLQWG